MDIHTFFRLVDKFKASSAVIDSQAVVVDDEVVGKTPEAELANGNGSPKGNCSNWCKKD